MNGPTFKQITLSAKLEGSNGSFSESFGTVGIPIDIGEAREKALQMVDRMFPPQDNYGRFIENLEQLKNNED